MLPLKTILVIWSPLLVRHNSFSYLLMIRTITVPWRKMILTVAGQKEDTALGNMIKICYKKARLYFSTCSNKDKKIYHCRGFSRINSETRTCVMEHQYCMEQIFSWLLCLYPFYHLLYLLKSFLCLFSSCCFDHSLFQYLCLICLKFWLCIFLFTVWMHVTTSLSDS